MIIGKDLFGDAIDIKKMITGKDLFDVIDIIRNEQVYRERLAALIQAESAYNEAKAIASTLAEANKLKDKATSTLNDANLYKEKIQKGIDELLAKTQVEYTSKMTQAQQAQDRADTQMLENKRLAEKREQLMAANLQEHNRLRQMHLDQNERENELNRKKEEFKSRVSQTQQIINKEI